MAKSALLLLAVSLSACENTLTPVTTVANNPKSSLGAVVSIALPGATSVRITTSDTHEIHTPYQSLDAKGNGDVQLLGLLPGTKYVLQVEGSDGVNPVTTSLPFTSGALPSALADVTVKMTPVAGTPRAGYYLVSGLTNAVFAVDETGAFRWYHDLGATHEETKMQTDGTFTTTVGATDGWQTTPSTYVRYTPDGADIATYTATTPYTSESNDSVYGDLHELFLTSDSSGAEHLHFIAYEPRPTSSTNSAPLMWHELVRQSPSGTVEFQWKSWSRYTIADVTETIPVAGANDTDHANALAIDPSDGNYVLSHRDLDAIEKIDYTTGNVIWQLGGKQNQFTIVGDPLNGFYGQHSLRILPNGNVLLYDNGLQHTPPESRAVEYALDTTKMTATMVWEFRHSPALFTPIIGSVERFSDGHTLVAFSDIGIFDEVDSSSTLLWEGTIEDAGVAGSAYRVRFLPSLTEFVQP